MKKYLVTLLLLASVALTACAKSTPTSLPTFPAATPTTNLEVPSSMELVAPDSGCTVVTKRPTPGPTQASLFPPVTEDDHVKGPENARVTIIEYSDFQ